MEREYDTEAGLGFLRCGAGSSTAMKIVFFAVIRTNRVFGRSTIRKGRPAPRSRTEPITPPKNRVPGRERCSGSAGPAAQLMALDQDMDL